MLFLCAILSLLLLTMCYTGLPRLRSRCRARGTADFTAVRESTLGSENTAGGSSLSSSCNEGLSCTHFPSEDSSACNLQATPAAAASGVHLSPARSGVQSPLQEVMNMVGIVDAACGTTPPPVRGPDSSSARARDMARTAGRQSMTLQAQLHRTAANAILLKKRLAKVWHRFAARPHQLLVAKPVPALHSNF